MGTVHKYVRRLIVWAQTYSDEELAQHNAAAKDIRRTKLARRARNALLTGKYYEEFIGLRAEDAENLIDDVKAIGAADPFIRQESVDQLVKYLTPSTHMRAPVLKIVEG
jgi:hypothetical protein